MTRDERDRGSREWTETEHLRRELRLWKGLFWLALVALVTLIAYSGWRNWEIGQRVDGIEEGHVVVTKRCMESLQQTTELLASAQVVCAAVPRVEAELLAPEEESAAEGGTVAPTAQEAP